MTKEKIPKGRAAAKRAAVDDAPAAAPAVTAPSAPQMETPAGMPAVEAPPASAMPVADAAPVSAEVAAPPPKSTPTLQLDSSLEIKDVEQVHRKLLALLESGSSIAVDISHVGAMDTAGAQLLLAFQGEAAKRDVAVAFNGRASAFTHALTALGLGSAIPHAISRD